MAQDATVVSMIQEGEWIWLDDRKRRWSRIEALPVPAIHANCTDWVLWRNNSGMELTFTVNMVWQDLRNNCIVVPWAKYVWFSQCIPKHAFIQWLVIKDRLLTQERILKWNPHLNSKCHLRSSEVDFRNHLFFKCELAKKVWESMRELCSLGNCNEDWHNVMNTIMVRKPNGSIWSIVQRLVYAASVYMIWKERNCRIFQKITDVVRLKLQSLNIGDSVEVNRMKCMWHMENGNLHIGNGLVGSEG